MNSNKKNTLSVLVELLQFEEDSKSRSSSKYEIKETRITSKEFLLQYPRGAYTTVRTVKRNSIMDLQGHGRLVEESEIVTKALEKFRDCKVFKNLLIELLKIGLKKYYEIEEEKGVGETKVTLIACYSFQESRPRMAAQFSPLHAPNSPRCKVEVYGEPRKHAWAKDSQWVRERKRLEETMHPGFNEIILTDSNTHNIYEGLSSNFFAVIYNPDTKQPLVVTAPLSVVLEGTIMKIVKMICGRDNIDFKYWFPNTQDVHLWEGTTRLVLPIELIKFRDGMPIAKLPPNNDTVEYIKQEVEKEIFNRAYRILKDDDLTENG
ncbi:12332_t:CDS:2 [Entrophospora sp. SA101]|nr:12332_t:CDS:2 [Entrophospora sp. SA101]